MAAVIFHENYCTGCHYVFQLSLHTNFRWKKIYRTFIHMRSWGHFWPQDSNWCFFLINSLKLHKNQQYYFLISFYIYLSVLPSRFCNASRPISHNWRQTRSITRSVQIFTIQVVKMRHQLGICCDAEAKYSTSIIILRHRERRCSSNQISGRKRCPPAHTTSWMWRLQHDQL